MAFPGRQHRGRTTTSPTRTTTRARRRRLPRRTAWCGRTGGSSARTAASPGTRTSPRFVVLVEHEVKSFYHSGAKGGTQRQCSICKQKTSYHCTICGEACPLHPPQVRGRARQFTCLAQHRAAERTGRTTPAPAARRISLH
mmetsp:Transcript_36813/g.86492  ORF Transcript_36813/g.86492 Transcript_36813/m.86492 type:complete len:141 (-) Transcript_36813:63-485(-)